MNKEEFLTGWGLIRAIPGPVFAVASYTGGMVLRDGGTRLHILGCIIGSLMIFLPSALLVLFFYPVWNNLKKYALVYRSLEGINAAVVGIMWASFFYLLKDLSISLSETASFINLFVILSTFFLLTYTKISPPLIVLGCLVLGFIF